MWVCMKPLIRFLFSAIASASECPDWTWAFGVELTDLWTDINILNYYFGSKVFVGGLLSLSFLQESCLSTGVATSGSMSPTARSPTRVEPIGMQKPTPIRGLWHILEIVAPLDCQFLFSLSLSLYLICPPLPSLSPLPPCFLPPFTSNIYFVFPSDKDSTILLDSSLLCGLIRYFDCSMVILDFMADIHL